MPNSILWIGLVVLWVFVLFPMLAARYPRIRRTTDTALATRVLHRGGTKRRAKSGPASGHDSDPDWVPKRVQRRLIHGDDAEDRMTTSVDESVTEHDDSSGAGGAIGAGDTEVIEAEAEVDDFDDADFDETDDAGMDDAGIDDTGIDDAEIEDIAADDTDTGDEPESAPVTARIPPARSASRPRRATGPTDSAFESDETEFPDVASHAEELDSGDAESDSVPGRSVPIRRGRGGYDPDADAIARVARYHFRQRTTLGLALSALLFGAFAVAVTPMLWWGCGLSGLVLVIYLVYLRRQVRLEEEIRRRRAARLSRGIQAPEAAQAAVRTAPSLDRDAARDLRRRAVVMDIDDEDPMFDFLDTFDAAAARATRTHAAGGEIRRAAGE